MAQSYPIWSVVQACIYKSSKSWGARDIAEVNVKVGSSSTYSNQFVNHKTTKKEIQKAIKEKRANDLIRLPDTVAHLIPKQ